MSAAWYVLRTQFQQEERAARELGNQGFETFLPLARVESRRARDGLLLAKVKPLFTTYLFVNFDHQVQRWHAILSTAGIKTFIGYKEGHDLPSAIPESDMRELRTRLQEVGGIFPLNLSRPKYITAGTIVRVLFGPFRDQAATVQVDHGTRVEVLLRFAGALRNARLPKDCLVVAA